MVAEQFASFFFTLVIGLILGAIIDAHRSFHRLVRPPFLIVTLGDFLLWLILALLVFFLLLFNNWGEIRAYVFIGMGTGLAIYHYWFSKTMLSFWYNLLLFAGKIVKLLFLIVIFPFKLLKSLLSILIGVVSYCFNFLGSLALRPIRKVIGGFRKQPGKLKRWFLSKIKKSG